MVIKTIKAGVYATNCYIVHREEDSEAIVIDPAGAYNDIKEYLNKNKLTPKYILLTHGHGDHIGAVLDIKKNYGSEIVIHENDEYMIKDAAKNFTSELANEEVEFNADKLVSDKEIIELNGFEIKVIHTPGHTQGSVCYKIKNHLFSGDTLFMNSIGRTDLEGGDKEQILSSIREQLLILPIETLIYPGHGPQTSLKKEKLSNPFL